MRYKSEEEADVLTVCLLFIDANRPAWSLSIVVTCLETVFVKRIARVTTETGFAEAARACERLIVCQLPLAACQVIVCTPRRQAPPSVFLHIVTGSRLPKQLSDINRFIQEPLCLGARANTGQSMAD